MAIQIPLIFCPLSGYIAHQTQLVVEACGHASSLARPWFMTRNPLTQLRLDMRFEGKCSDRSQLVIDFHILVQVQEQSGTVE